MNRIRQWWRAYRIWSGGLIECPKHGDVRGLPKLFPGVCLPCMFDDYDKWRARRDG
jgi:hypothetical protein